MKQTNQSTSRKSTTTRSRRSPGKTPKWKLHDTESITGKKYKQIIKRAKPPKYEAINTEEFDRKYRQWLQRRGLVDQSQRVHNNDIFSRGGKTSKSYIPYDDSGENMADIKPEVAD